MVQLNLMKKVSRQKLQQLIVFDFEEIVKLVLLQLV